MSRRDLRSTGRNTLAVARREFLWRGHSRAFAIGTAFLVIVSVGVALAPVILRAVNRGGTGERIAVYVGNSAPTVAVAPALQAILNSTATSAPTTGANAAGANAAASTEFVVTQVTDPAAARADVEADRAKALLSLSRTSSGELTYTLLSKMQPFERTAQLVQQAVSSITIQDRLAGLGIPPGDQAALFAPPPFAFESATKSGSGGPGSQAGGTVEQLVGGSIIGFALTILIFMAIMLYGQWVAMSVAEEKSSRVMEVILGAARPVELMAGKVLGVGSLALVQFVAVAAPTALVVIFQDRIASAVLGEVGSTDLPSGLTVPVLVAFGVFLVLGFALYATLYAAIASLVSRQEDVNQMVGPLTLISTAGYLIGVYASSGIIEMSSPLVRVLSFIPFLSPYIMLSRVTVGGLDPWEPVVAVAILLVTIAGTLWVGGRVYGAGVLMYGQKPGWRTFVQAMRAGQA